MKRLFRRKKRLRDRFGKILKQTKSVLFMVGGWLIHVFLRFSGDLRRRATVAKMKKADIVLASPRTVRLSPIALAYRLFLRSKYVHSMLYIGNGRILHTTTRHGVVVTRLPRKIFRKDRYATFRVKNLTEPQRERVVQEALKWKDRKLDHAGLVSNVPSKLVGLKKPLLRWEKNRIWCSKLIYRAFLAADIEVVPPDRAQNITSEDLSRSLTVKRI